MPDQHAKPRSAYWDNIKGLLIFLVVFGHLLFDLQKLIPCLNTLVDGIYLFHMPAFVFISGYFGKSKQACGPQAIIKLLFLYVIFNSAMGFNYGFNSLLVPLYSCWYLLALVVWRIITPYLASFKYAVWLSFLVALFAGFYPSIDNTLSAARIIGFFPYYLCGYLLSTSRAEALCSCAYWPRLLKGLGVWVLGMAIGWMALHFFNYTDEALQMGAYAQWKIDAFARIVLYATAFTIIYALRCLSPNRSLPFLTLFGRNSLWIFLMHRPLVLLLSPWLNLQTTAGIIVFSGTISFLLCCLCGNDVLACYMNRFAAQGMHIFIAPKTSRLNTAKAVLFTVGIGFILLALYKAYEPKVLKELRSMSVGTSVQNTSQLPTRLPTQTLSPAQKQSFDSAFRITFAGDLILLEDQVKRGYRNGKYDFSEVFEYARKYIEPADLAVGVFEGPMAGEKAGYSHGNFDDQKELFLNFPVEFATAIKQAGFDLVTTANNHLLDKGLSGAIRTLDTLDKIGLDHTGSYRNLAEKENKKIKLLQRQGIKMAFLSYTYGSNYIDTKDLAGGKLSFVTSVIADPHSPFFEASKEQVEQDFKKAKALQPDLIIVLPHTGTQFANMPDEQQKVWFDIFKQNGADIILGDHPHVVEPITVEPGRNGLVVTGYCPGNFANIYRTQQGDTSMLVDVYIDRTTKKVLGAGMVPLYTQARADGNYRALPIYDIVHNPLLRQQLSTDDEKRAQAAFSLISQVVLGTRLDISAIAPRYYLNEKGWLRQKAEPIALNNQMKQGILYKTLAQKDSVCFIGDSVTQGSKNGGYPWYEPLEPYLSGKAIYNYSKNGATVSDIIVDVALIPPAQLYVIALGTNDVRYRNASCAMTPQDYINRLEDLKNKLLAQSPNAQFIFIAPWYSTDGDPFSPLPFAQKTALNETYSQALLDYCHANGLGYIDPNPYIRQALDTYPRDIYLLDHIHPNAGKGIALYTRAALL